jgi:anaerobic magnesium-protoporphyrin IX monomethyl ester cyclase
MKIMLIRPNPSSRVNTRLPESINRRIGLFPPLGLAYVASALLQDGHAVEIMDAEALGLAPAEVGKRILAFDPELVGISAFSPSFLDTLEVAKIAKAGGRTVMIGGPQVAAYPEESVSHECVDYGVLGEGETPARKLAAILSGRGAGPEKTPGLVWKKNGSVRVNGPWVEPDLDALPPPWRDGLPVERYFSIFGLKPVTTMMAGRGCAYRCSFCSRGPSDESCRRRSPAKIAEEMAEVVLKHGVREIMFYDDTFTFDRKFVRSLCAEISRRGTGVKWEAPTRPDLVDRETLESMKDAGCVRLRFGVESGDPEILKAMGRGMRIETIRAAFREAREAGIETFAYFQAGYPGEDERSFRMSLALALELNPDHAMFTLTTPYPGTSLYEDSMKSGAVAGDPWRETALGRNTDRMPALAQGAHERVKRAYRAFYLRPSYIAKSLVKSLGSFEAFKRNLKGMQGLIFYEDSI